MVIEDNRKLMIPFCDTEAGDIFVLEDKYYMTMCSCYEFGTAWSFERNCVCQNMDRDTLVQKVNAKIVIYD